MRPSIARYVTACQQLLALGVVLAVLAPAASVISLEVVQAPGASAPAAAVQPLAEVETAPVEATVHETPMQAPGPDTAPEVAEVEPAALDASTEQSEVGGDTLPEGATARRAVPPAGSETPAGHAEDDAHADDQGGEHQTSGEHDHSVDGVVAAVSAVEPVDGFGAVGVTWDSSEELGEGDIAVEVRTQTDQEWSDWTTLHFHPQDGPDPQTAEGRNARPGTEPLLVGEVDAVQARAITPTGTAPVELRLSVISPGESVRTERAAPEIALDAPASTEGPTEGPAGAPADGDEAMVLQAAAKPTIYSRSQWGMTSKSKVETGKVNGAVMHHTVTANDYTQAQVPAMLRSIHAYHTKSRGWRDIGYNFLVDRFGRIWEGRYGGANKAVIGAQATGYNHLTFGVSALGNYDVQEPTAAMMEAYAQLIAWKLGHHGVTANTTWKNGGKTFNTIIGHRDVGSTACPGRYIYNKLASVRTRAATLQRGGAATPPPPSTPTARAVVPAPRTNLAGSPFPDLVLRRKSDNTVVILPTEGLLNYKRAKGTPKKVKKFNEMVVSPDLTGDGRPDLVVRRKKDGKVLIRPGRKNGKFAKPARTFGKKFAGFESITAVGDLNGDGRNDLVARRTKNRSLHLFTQTKKGGFKRSRLIGGKKYDYITATGDVTGDGRADLIARDLQGRLWVHPGTGTRTVAARRLVGSGYGQYDVITGFGDFNADGRADLFARTRSGAGYVLPGNGAGGFGYPHGPISGVRNLAKLSGGGTLVGGAGPDLVGRNKKGKLIVVRHVGRYDTGRAIVTNLQLSGTDILLNAGDWTGDGHGDLIIRRKNNGRLRVRPGNGSGSFGAAITITKSDFRGIELFALGDLTGDGKPDLLGRTAAGALFIYPGNGTGSLGAAIPAQSLPTLRGVDLAPYDWVRWTTDPRLGPAPGLLVRERSTGRIFALLNDGSGALKQRRFLVDGLAGYDLYG